ncbi:hypothetical protein [Patulibacter sp. SYSU D01012]|uniref:hypothetical protein n=1 Tax=Patulibacter sp. SYSU D01012 TaxID=2817381 RepID=UPI001B3140A2|nr:hypothetical protein [Patulibacter sp. SYSU D01012]
MALTTVSAETNFRHLIVLGGVRYGYFNGEEVDFGSEANDDWDPELGPVLVGGGRQTADDLKLERPWLPSRDRPAYMALKPLRNRVRGTASLFEVDEFEQPLSSEPLDVVTILLTNVTMPASSSSGDAGKLKLTVKVQA